MYRDLIVPIKVAIVFLSLMALSGISSMIPDMVVVHCRHCGWSDFGCVEKCRAPLLKHLWDWHDPQPKPRSNDRMPAPGR